MSVVDVAVVGAGFAGCAVAHAVLRRGLSVKILERGAQLAAGASGNRRALAIPYVTRAPQEVGAFYQAAFRSLLARLEALGDAARAHPHGALQLPSTRRVEALLGMNVQLEGIAQAVSQGQASELAGAPIHSAALYYPTAVSVDPAGVCQSLARGAEVQCGVAVAAAKREGRHWMLLNADGEEIARCVALVIATAYESNRLPQLAALRVVQVRGQLAALHGNEVSRRLKMAVCYDGYILPADKGVHVLGASYDHEYLSPVPCQDREQDLQRRLSRWLPELGGLEVAPELARVSFRASTHDRLPYIGAIPDHNALYVSVGHGSRGLLSALQGGELVADQITEGKSPSAWAGLLSPRRCV